MRHSANPAMEARARAANEAAQIGLAAERERQARLLRQTFGLEPYEEQAIAKALAKPTTPGSWTPVLFASSSMPMPALRSYAAQLERAHGVIAFRGLPGGMKKIAPFAKLSAEVLRIDPGCVGPACAMRDVQIVVDPIVFRQHAVSRVPALAMVPGDPAQAYCERSDEAAATPPAGARVVYGDSALAGLLDEYARLGGKEEVRDAQSLLGIR
jgi:type-F conjugative transfer system pilin assembly protein TrbC